MTTTSAGLVRQSGAAADVSTSEDVAIFSAFTITATVWLLFATAVGLLLSFTFTYPDLAANPLLSFGRLRAIHTNGIFYGWASIALTGLAFHVAARSSGVQLQHANRLGGKYMVRIAETIVRRGLLRRESRDAHTRVDFSEQSDELQKVNFVG